MLGEMYRIEKEKVQRRQALMRVDREAWKYPGLSWERTPGLRVRVAVTLVALAERLAPGAARQAADEAATARFDLTGQGTGAT